MKSTISIIALILIVAGFVCVVLGYSPANSTNQSPTNSTQPNNQTYPYTPPTTPSTPPSHQDQTQPLNPPPPWTPPHIVPRSIYLDVFGQGFEFDLMIVGIILIVAGLLLMWTGGT